MRIPIACAIKAGQFLGITANARCHFLKRDAAAAR